MDAEWGGLETLLAAAKFVELQEQEKNQKLIEICGELMKSIVFCCNVWTLCYSIVYISGSVKWTVVINSMFSFQRSI